MSASSSQIKIGSFVTIEGETFKIVNYEKPYEHFAGHYTIQSLQSGKIAKVFKHQLCLMDQVEKDFLKDSQSDEEICDLAETQDEPQEEEPKSKRFKSCTEEDLDQLAQARNEKNTVKQTAWGVKLFRDWLKENHYSVDFENLEASALNDRLRVFYGCLRTKQGNEYSKSALVGIRSAISRHINGPPYNRPFKLMADRAFMTSNNVLLGIIKKLKREGKDTTVHKKAISEGDIEKLYSSGVFDTSHPATLQNKVFWDVMLNFGRRGQEGLHDLKKKTSYIKCTDDKGMKYYTMAYNECDKTHHGVDNRENIKDTRMYEKSGDVNCPVLSLDLYLSKLSDKCSAFFQQPLINPRVDCWYAAQPFGKNKIAAWMSKLSKSANLSKQYSNHCIKATVATNLYRQGVDILKIMSVTGHRNVKSLESYINDPTDNDRRNLSSKLQKATIPTCNSSRPTELTDTDNVLTLSSKSVYSSSSVELEVSNEQSTSSALNILNKASITGGTFTFNIVQKDKM